MTSTRISGFASGLDIDAIVKKFMTAEKVPLDKLSQKKQLLEWKRENYRETSTKFITFSQSKINDTFSKLSSLNAQKTNVSGNTTAVTAKATTSAAGNMEIEVTQLAKAASTKSSAAPTKTGSETDWGNVLLSDIANSGISGSGKVTVQINGADIEIDAATETLGSFVNKINSNSKAGVTAIFDSSTGQVSITSKTTGAASNNITLSGDIFTNGLKLNAQLAGGQDATANINGLTINKSSNNFTLNGVDITLNSLSNGQATRVEVTKDVDKIVETVQSFVDSYNELMSFMNGKVNEERYTKYAPLTTDQRSDMSEGEIKLWEEKAKSGMLKRDSILTGAIQEMRTAMIQSVKLDSSITIGTQTTDKLSMTNIGITTGPYETRGKLILDTDKLKAAIEENPDIVSDFLGKNYSTSYTKNDYDESDGIFSRMRKIANKTLDDLATTAGTSKVSTELTSSFNNTSNMGEQLRILDVRIADLTSKLSIKETNYYKKFTAMETAINKYNSTSTALSKM
ncbi:flagellar filament capping protein FliD [Paenibacillus barcinonensis]|jgi:flagellar hook-associated protein 2|uniref:flagellar filament capping protein FliD n=1 Tax=Paenibacillus TaxID=44249 RepID=UPI001C121537|nr:MULTISPECIES: flagellar filament capping protein FliD [Paenibacillus]MBU5355386.1 flagellar filament capping protein FliD [Paenibacillus barcinonensis]MDM5281330.1 flagellar filament capping protein FliD [Paenibacillus silvae]